MLRRVLIYLFILQMFVNGARHVRLPEGLVSVGSFNPRIIPMR